MVPPVGRELDLRPVHETTCPTAPEHNTTPRAWKTPSTGRTVRATDDGVPTRR